MWICNLRINWKWFTISRQLFEQEAVIFIHWQNFRFLVLCHQTATLVNKKNLFVVFFSNYSIVSKKEKKIELPPLLVQTFLIDPREFNHTNIISFSCLGIDKFRSVCQLQMLPLYCDSRSSIIATDHSIQFGIRLFVPLHHILRILCTHFHVLGWKLFFFVDNWSSSSIIMNKHVRAWKCSYITMQESTWFIC